jgi:hypothetical protein
MDALIIRLLELYLWIRHSIQRLQPRHPIICLGQSAVLNASSYGPPPFPIEDFQNANPAGWSGNDANNNNKDDNSTWGETANGKTFNGLTFNSQAPPTNSKFMIVNGVGDGFNWLSGHPPFSLVGLTNPTFNFYTAGNFNAGTVATVQISTDGGLTYTTLLTYPPPRIWEIPIMAGHKCPLIWALILASQM